MSDWSSYVCSSDLGWEVAGPRAYCSHPTDDQGWDAAAVRGEMVSWVLPRPRHDAIGGIAVVAWVLGMGLTLGLENDAWQIAGAYLWAGGFAVAGGVAVHAYRMRSRALD